MEEFHEIDFGVLHPETTKVYGPEDSHHVFLRGRKGVDGWPYEPEVFQRRRGSPEAALGLTLLIQPELQKLVAKARITFGGGALEFIRECRDQFGWAAVAANLWLPFLQILRPASPQGVEWDMPGGVLEQGEPGREAVVRETTEETGLRVQAKTLLLNHQQFASGAYREWYEIWLVLAKGSPTVNLAEGILRWHPVPLFGAEAWILDQNAVPPIARDCCWVDAKVLLGLYHLRALLGAHG